jgi:hypothetical protein
LGYGRDRPRVLASCTLPVTVLDTGPGSGGGGGGTPPTPGAANTGRICSAVMISGLSSILIPSLVGPIGVLGSDIAAVVEHPSRAPGLGIARPRRVEHFRLRVTEHDIEGVDHRPSPNSASICALVTSSPGVIANPAKPVPSHRPGALTLLVVVRAETGVAPVFGVVAAT